MSDTTTPRPEVHPLDWHLMEVSAAFCQGREYYPAVTLDVHRHALRKLIYDLNETMRHD